MEEKPHNVSFWTGQSLEMITTDDESYFTQIIQHEPALLVKRPINNKNIPLKINNGMPVTVYFYGDSNQLYAFDTSIYSLPNKRILLKRPAPDAIKKAQRRRFFRIQVAVPMDLFIPLPGQLGQFKKLQTYSYDISGGGVSFLSPEKEIAEQEIIEGILYLDMKGKPLRVEFKGKVVYMLTMPNNIHRTAIQFIEMSEPTRSEIIRFCLFKQVELRSKLKGTGLE